MNLMAIDYETYWSGEHSLTKMSPFAYVMHPDTEIQSVAIARPDTATVVLWGEAAIRDYYASVDWGNTLVVGHNLEGFDALIHAWRFGIKPKLWACTKAMGRLHAKTTKLSLRDLSAFYGLGEKGSLEATNTKGKRLADFSAEERLAMHEYNALDAELCLALFLKLSEEEPFRSHRRELLLLHDTLRMTVEPQFEADVRLLIDALKAERSDKAATMQRVAEQFGIDPDDVTATEQVRKQLNSTAKFSAFLESRGVPVPMKESPTTGKPIPALAKSDEGFLNLREHDDPDVRAVVEARLASKSTLLETRLLKFMEATRAAPRLPGGGFALPIPLKYNGADTTGRWSGWAFNPQNLPRVNPKQPQITDALRKSLRAPAGKRVVVADLSGIELRVNHFLWQVPSSMSLFKASPDKADLYKDFASTLYGVPIESVTKLQRQVGKVAHLGLGYGAGAETFRSVARSMGGVTLTDIEAKNVVTSWRAAYPEIVEGWAHCQRVIRAMHLESEGTLDPWGLLTYKSCRITSPMGTIHYPNLRRQDEEWVYGDLKPARLFGGKMVENLVQHLARQVLADILFRVRDTELGRRYPLAHTVHDELVYVVDEDDAEAMLDLVQQTMRTPPDWWPELVVWSEGDIAQTYGDAK